MLKDEFGTVYNGPETFHDIASLLQDFGACLIPWTDQAGTQYDILFAILHKEPQTVSRQLIQGGVTRWDLFVSIMRVGAFGFDIENTDTHPGYYAEKLKLTGDETNKKLAEMINGIKVEWHKIRTGFHAK